MEVLFIVEIEVVQALTEPLHSLLVVIEQLLLCFDLLLKHGNEVLLFRKCGSELFLLFHCFVVLEGSRLVGLLELGILQLELLQLCIQLAQVCRPIVGLLSELSILSEHLLHLLLVAELLLGKFESHLFLHHIDLPLLNFFQLNSSF